MKIMEPIGTALPIFESTGQALHVAFTIMSQDAQQDCMFRKSLISMLDSMTYLSPRLTDWLQQLRGSRSETVNFEGLAGNEIRAQCALIMSAVRSKLPDPERWAVHAKYSITDFEDIDGKRRYAFSIDKINAIRSLASWLIANGELSTMPLLAMDCLVAKFYSSHARTGISFREMEKAFGLGKSSCERGFKRVKVRLSPLEPMAVNRLQPYFEQQGIVHAQ